LSTLIVYRELSCGMLLIDDVLVVVQNVASDIASVVFIVTVVASVVVKDVASVS